MNHMYEHINNIKYNYGNAYVQIPNNIFSTLSSSIKDKNGKTNIKQISFAYAYVITICFLYKYAHFIDIDNGTYIQNNDIKQILGYGKTTKSVDKIIKQNGILEEIGLIRTTNNYPVEAKYDLNEKINNISMREFVYIESVDDSYMNYNLIKSIVKNSNYNVKEPLFFFENNNDVGTLYNYKNTHRIDIDEFLSITYNENFNNIDFMLYFYFKSKCYGLKDDTKSITLNEIVSETGIGKDSFYNHINQLKIFNCLNVNHKGWRFKNDCAEIDANDYCFIGI